MFTSSVLCYYIYVSAFYAVYSAEDFEEWTWYACKLHSNLKPSHNSSFYQELIIYSDQFFLNYLEFYWVEAGFLLSEWISQQISLLLTPD